MAKKTNKTSHVLDLLTNGTSSEAGGNSSRVTIPKKVTVVDENSRSNRLSEELLNSLSEELGQEVPHEEETPAPSPAPQAAAAPAEIAIITTAVMPKSLFCRNKDKVEGVSTGTGIQRGIRATMARVSFVASQH